MAHGTTHSPVSMAVPGGSMALTVESDSERDTILQPGPMLEEQWPGVPMELEEQHRSSIHGRAQLRQRVRDRMSSEAGAQPLSLEATSGRKPRDSQTLQPVIPPASLV